MRVLLCLFVFLMGGIVLGSRPQGAVSFSGSSHKLLTSSVTFMKSHHLVQSRGETRAAIVVKGDNLVIDFGGLTLQGTSTYLDPDKRTGVGILVMGSNVTIKNLNVHGYKFGVIARKSPGLKLLNCDASRNWRQRLLSTPEAEDLGDWMSFHHNEKDEWMQYGAGFYLTDCENFLVENCKAVSGQSGLMLTRCDKGIVRNNNFSFLSAIGLGMYRSSDNKVYQNRIDWCVRGYSHGVYNRGQDSAGILIYEQSNRNIFAFNSVTHGGDGFFLWAGQTTMDTGKGGCNDNLIAYNDFSHAPTNGIEATFSRNKFIGNLIMECWHGVWGGFSYESEFRDNIFAYNGEAIAIEHGQDNLIRGNQFYRDKLGIRLWANEKVDPNWGYGKTRDTRSRDYAISHNTFTRVTPSLKVTKTRDFDFSKNSHVDCSPVPLGEAMLGGSVANNPVLTTTEKVLEPDLVIDQNAVIARLISDEAYQSLWKTPKSTFAQLLRSSEARKLGTQLQISKVSFPSYSEQLKRGRANLIIDEWGPYDYETPILKDVWTATAFSETFPGTLAVFEILGPEQTWTVTQKQGIESIGIVNRICAVTLTPGTTYSFTLKGSKGGAIKHENTNIPLTFTGGIYPWNSASDPRTHAEEFNRLLMTTPTKSFKDKVLSLATSNDFFDSGLKDNFATVAISKVAVAAGEYELTVTTDDGCRVYLDDQLILDEWRYQGPTTYTKKLTLKGGHTIKVVHFEIDGYSALKVKLRRLLK